MESKWVTIVRERFDEERGRLDLSWNGIRDNDISEIIEACSGLHNIEELILYENKIGRDGFRHLSTAKFSDIVKLYLNNNNIGAEGADYLAAVNFPNLGKLFLSKYINIYIIITLQQKEQGTYQVRTSQSSRVISFKQQHPSRGGKVLIIYQFAQSNKDKPIQQQHCSRRSKAFICCQLPQSNRAISNKQQHWTGRDKVLISWQLLQSNKAIPKDQQHWIAKQDIPLIFIQEKEH